MPHKHIHKKLFETILFISHYRLKLEKENRISGPKKENLTGPQTHRKRGKCAGATPAPHHTTLEERSDRLIAHLYPS